MPGPPALRPLGCPGVGDSQAEASGRELAGLPPQAGPRLRPQRTQPSRQRPAGFPTPSTPSSASSPLSPLAFTTPMASTSPSCCTTLMTSPHTWLTSSEAVEHVTHDAVSTPIQVPLHLCGPAPSCPPRSCGTGIQRLIPLIPEPFSHFRNSTRVPDSDVRDSLAGVLRPGRAGPGSLRTVPSMTSWNMPWTTYPIAVLCTSANTSSILRRTSHPGWVSALFAPPDLLPCSADQSGPPVRFIDDQ